MREISLDEDMTDLPVMTVLNYGDTKTGKTTFASTWPRPLILADAVERGYESVRTADRSTWFEPDWKPRIIALESLADLVQLAAPGGQIDQWIAKGEVRTIVNDALSYFCELMLNAIIQMQGKPDNRAAYGDLGKQLRNVRTMVQAKPASVLWNCIVKHPEEDDPRGRPLIPGKQGEAWPGACDFVFRSQVKRERVMVNYEEIDEATGKTKIVPRPEIQELYFMNTRQNGKYIGGSRLGTKADMLPDPFSGSYSDLVTCLGYDVEKLRKIAKQPPKPRAGSLAVPTTAAPKAPPIVITRPAPKAAAAPSQANNNKR